MWFTKPMVLDAAALALLAVVFGVASASAASSEPSLEPGGVYPLKPGIYVAQGANCAAPPDATVRVYNGKGIRTVQTRDCRAAVREHEGSSYTVDQTCLDASVGLGRRFVQRQQVIVADALNFTQATGKERTAYRYCPTEQLPAALRKTAD